ncbi:glycosyltransferase family 4 protein [Mucilaginibacter sp. UYCu711]|uniref:glycosyltransferase family 4 protein n=1 Tax=Mucilaginibacter sp. UYCu711 TaxID=3156339 RepID=UPI003D2524DD
MNILIYSTVFYPSVGGIENQTLLLIKNFVEKGHAVKVITYQKQSEPFEYCEVFYRPNFIKSIQLFLWCTTFFMPNISLKGIWLMFLHPKKNWIISHNDFSSCDKHGIMNKLKNVVNTFANTNVAVSKSIANHLSHNVTVIRNCYDEEIFKVIPQTERSIDFVFLGRLVSQKGADLLIRACSRLEFPFSLLIIGDGPEKANLNELTKQLNLTESIKFKGTLKGEQLAVHLNKCRVMVIPSMQNEGFGMVVLEGLACGCKIIAANAGGLHEAVGKHGKNFEMGNEIQLHFLLESFLKDNTNDISHQDGLATYLEKHSSSIVAANYLQYFN